MTAQRRSDIFIPVLATSRTGKWGRDIKCPHCDYIAEVSHFSWVALQCTGCERMVNKVDYQMRLTTARLRKH